MFPWELKPFPRETTLFLKEGAFLPMNLGPSLRKIICSFKKLYFSPRNFFYSMGNLFGIGIYISFAWGSYFPRAINFKNYLNVIWIFSSISFVGKYN